MTSKTFKLFGLKPLLLAGAITIVPQAASAEVNAGSAALGSTLEDFFTAALDYSPHLKISEQRRAIGAARRDAATGQLKPQISANATLTDNRRRTGDSLNEFDGERYSIQLRQVLFDWEAFSARKQATSERDRSEAEYFYELSVLLTEVSDKYFDVLQAQGEVESKNAELEAVKKQRSQIQSQFDRQLAQITDLLQSKASVAAVEAEKIQLQSELDLAREALRSTSGLDVGKLFDLADDAAIPSASRGIAAWVAMAHSNNYQIQAREFATKATEAGISRSKGAFWPNASLVVQRQDSGVGFDNAPIQDSETTYVGIDFYIPIYSGGSRSASLRESRSLHAIAQSELEQIKLDTSELVRSAYLLFEASKSFIKAAQILVESTTATADAMQKGFDLGTVTNVDVLNAIRDRFEAQRRLQQSKYDSIKYYLLLKRESGSLTAQDMVEVSSWLTSTASTSFNETKDLAYLDSDDWITR